MTTADLTGVRITMADLIPPYCPWGVKRWFRLHRLDFADFLANGVDAQTLVNTGDAQALDTVQRKLEVGRERG